VNAQEEQLLFPRGADDSVLQREPATFISSGRPASIGQEVPQRGSGSTTDEKTPADHDLERGKSVEECDASRESSLFRSKNRLDWLNFDTRGTFTVRGYTSSDDEASSEEEGRSRDNGDAPVQAPQRGSGSTTDEETSVGRDLGRGESVEECDAPRESSLFRSKNRLDWLNFDTRGTFTVRGYTSSDDEGPPNQAQ